MKEEEMIIRLVLLIVFGLFIYKFFVEKVEI